MNKAVWRKLGLLITPRKDLWWSQSHCMVPTTDHISGNVYRVLFSGRNSDNRSSIGYAVVEVGSQPRVLEYSVEPVLMPGQLGCFDDCGVTPSSVVTLEGRKYLYYIGWKQRSSTRMGLLPGLALSDDGGLTYKRFSRAPILPETDAEPFSVITAPYVIRDQGAWRMWYVSCVGWVNPDLPRYNIKYAHSDDGIYWVRKPAVAIDFNSPSENSLARPWVVKDDLGWHMWFSYKADYYRIGYAFSKDSYTWERLDELAGIDVSGSGWDSEMIEYACVFKCAGRDYMLYNGNNYGVDGIGIAVRED